MSTNNLSVINYSIYSRLANESICSYEYYKDKTPKVDLEEFSNDNNIEFIKEFIAAGRKEKLVENIDKAYFDTAEDKYSMRASHSVSIYLIGLLLFKQSSILSTYINKQFDHLKIQAKEEMIELEFKYAWFLLCLYHDYNSYKERANSQNDINVEFIEGELDNIFAKLDSIKDPYTLNNIKAYSRYRNKKAKNDHGIIGGCQLYKILSDNIDKVIEETNPTDKNNHLDTHGIRWSLGHKSWHAFIASIIIKHNIWFKNIDVHSIADIKEYVANKISAFIIDNNSRMSFDDDPLLFIFCIIDTIEPIKLLHKCNDKNVNILKGVDISIKDIGDKLQLSITKSDNFDQCKFELIAQRAKTLQDWMKVEVTTCDYLVTIKWSV